MTLSLSDTLLAAFQHSVFDFKVLDVAGNEVSLADYAGSVTLIVNVASKCDLTGVNYRELQRLHRQFGPRGFAVLAFPSNQFGGMEPGTDDEIEKFARDKYHATFPLFAKVDVNGKGAHPLFTFLKNAFGIKEIPWNFQKFLCDRTGRPVLQFPSQIDPLAFVKDIEALLDKGKGLLPSRKGQPLLGSLVH
ncbi:glutathione peroxidase [Baffinella frigidus]|nr:glutathione peroxidase [Cryptophyta sp. CCMP2293]